MLFMIASLLLWQCLTIQQILDRLIAGSALTLMVSCVMMITMQVKSKQLDRPIEPMVSAVNQVSPESIATMMELTLAVNLQVELETGLEVFSLKERISKCLLSVQVLEIKRNAESVMTQRILI